MKHLLTVLCAFMLLGVQAQTDQKKETKEERQQRYIDEVNPFRELGYKPKIATLSKGKYREAFPDTIVQIGGFTYNVLSKQVTGVVVTENLGLSEADLKPDIVSRWMSPDPLSEEFPDKSPYNFTNNNPIFFTDPTGLAPQGLLDDYGIDKNGNIALIQETDDNFDRLYAVDDNGDKVDTNGDGEVNASDSETINDQTILPELAEVKETSESSYHGTKKLSSATRGEKSQNDIFKIFNFAANNSNVEWSVARANVNGENQFGIGTYHNRSVSPGYVGLFDAKNVISEIHSHPNIPATSQEERGSLLGDSWRRTSLSNKGINFSYYTYFPNSGNIMSNGNNGASFIRNTKGNYKRFFFGTLNTK
ncbi:JAB-like toxin 1 domain-containing protein [Aquimarina macrocephali]|uniref:JAB-like toxin 1 domain-containing protein n=1 Tax=Aquimarina macrocephali TaxID=666563 RepID=UPI000559185B|nr:JAB-like toxin 1 domain-containing protein [Aquimarina macrocephali]